MKLSEELAWRGFVAQHTFSAITNLDEKKRNFYLGVDPSDDSMTIGNLAALMMCKVFIRHGYRPTLLVGGATGMIGDPKETGERESKTIEEIERNKKGIHEQFVRIMGTDVPLVDNYDWFRDIKFLPFLRDIGKQFSMTQLLDRDFVKTRIGEGRSGISYAEFSYSLIQGYDFLYLFREHDVTLQLCGADQWGNSVSGVHLVKRLENAEVNVWSTPLILNKTTGRKFGKSEDNAIWLDPIKTSPYQFYQFWLNVDDAGVIDYLKIYTELDREKIDAIANSHAGDPAARTAQRALAYEVTKIVHGADVADNVVHVTNVLFGADNIRDLSDEALDILAKEIPTVRVGMTAVEALVETDIANSNSEALRLIGGGAVSVNGNKITEDQVINEKALVKKGKNSFVLVK